MTALPMILGVVGTGISFMGQMQAASAARAAGAANAQIAENQAKNILAEGRENMGRARTEAERRLASMRARMAAGGSGITGSHLDFLEESASRLETNILDIGRQSSVNALNARIGGAMSQFEAKNQASAYRTGAFGTLLTGVGSIAKTAYNTGYYA